MLQCRKLLPAGAGGVLQPRHRCCFAAVPETGWQCRYIGVHVTAMRSEGCVQQCHQRGGDRSRRECLLSMNTAAATTSSRCASCAGKISISFWVCFQALRSSLQTGSSAAVLLSPCRLPALEPACNTATLSKHLQSGVSTPASHRELQTGGACQECCEHDAAVI